MTIDMPKPLLLWTSFDEVSYRKNLRAIEDWTNAVLVALAELAP